MKAFDFEINTENAIGVDELEERIAQGKRLKVKLGVDPTRPDLTFGHLVVFNKLREFQDQGHEAILIIGDYTAMIGDPSGRSSTRPVLTAEDVKINSQTYLDQAFRVLDKEKTTVRYNSEWFGKMGFADCLELSRKMTVARMLERDDFSKRYASNTPISIVEFLYPLIQGYDSLILDADVELGGSDQLFNMLVGRALQKDAGKPEQAVLTLPLLVGLDGYRKMSKSYDNYVSFNDSPQDMFGKVMSIPDDTMWEYYRLLLLTDAEEIARRKQGHPMDAKKNLAQELVSRFHSPESGEEALRGFEQVFSRGENPEDMTEVSMKEHSLSSDSKLVEAMDASGLFPSKKEIIRLIGQGAVKRDGERIDDRNELIGEVGEGQVIQAGKRKFFRLVP
ncbi:tyrosine--tRNA ligase [Puniceicoccus vermicola]|uniref:Tyrosine--tRNA ligase n=1 Tax=Puniceicoccus vermicola TaxID=388746 RepID=A0A7X1E5X7_9BACT|nr:tyrosine--tRNA ligase [Puniceicoccus vermicola]MBC2603606.1 tyrosine--tRNA ligase [Puniceicoccus vermicola]